jgi:hypothetical protein
VWEEADESMYWLEIIKEANLVIGLEINRLIRESNELTANFAATAKTAKAKLD